jgi:hypothetical protein
MRGWWIVAGSLGLLGVAYAADRWIRVIDTNVSIYGTAESWRELGMAVALGGRLLLLIGIVAIFVALRVRAVAGWVVPVIVAIGAVLAMVMPILVGVALALPEGLAFVYLTDATEPLLSGGAVFVPWVSAGLLAVGIAARLPGRDRSWGPARARILVLGAVLLFFATYLLDDLFRAAGMELASSIAAYPQWAGIGLVSRLVVMSALAVLLIAAAHGEIRPSQGALLLAMGLAGFVVLPIVALVVGPAPRLFDETLAGTLDPGTAGRWMAGGMVVTATLALARPGIGRSATPAIDSGAPRMSPA